MKKRIGINMRSLLQYLATAMFTLFFVFPYIWLILNSLKSKQEIFSLPMTIIPKVFHPENFINALKFIPLVRYTLNTFIVVVGATVGAVVISSLTAYGFSKINWKGRDKIFVLILATLILPFQVTMIPMFIMFTKMHLTSTLLPLILPRFFDAFYIFLIRQFLMGVPNEMMEAAKIDGCSHARIFRAIALPLIQPAIITVAIFEINARWQDFFSPLVFLRSQKLYTMALGLRAYTTLYGTEWDLLLAASVMFTLPMIIVFLVFQKKFIEGISTAGIKA